MEAMGQLSTAVRNVLKLMNTPLGSVATTMIGGFLAAGGMKAVLTGMTMKGKDSFMTRSGAAIGGGNAGAAGGAARRRRWSGSLRCGLMVG